MVLLPPRRALCALPCEPRSAPSAPRGRPRRAIGLPVLPAEPATRPYEPRWIGAPLGDRPRSGLVAAWPDDRDDRLDESRAALGKRELQARTRELRAPS